MSQATSKPRFHAELIEVPLKQLRPGNWFRNRFVSESAVSQEMAVIRQHRVCEPLVIRRAGKAGFEIVTGEVRWQAAKRLGLRAIPCQVSALNEREARQLSLLEALKQVDLSPLEEADILSELLEDYGLRQSELAALTGRSKTQISRAIRISSLPVELKDKIREGNGLLTRAQLIEAAEHPQFAEWILTDRPTLREIRLRLSQQMCEDRSRAAPARSLRVSRPPASVSGVCYDEFEDGRGFRLKVHYDEATCGPEQRDEIIHTLKVALFLLGELDLNHAVNHKRVQQSCSV
ncbi:MAG: ParB/RepB/Spo0J family partition protein [Planctomycetes bacterium]|nr:ParB/RepB/Spo0J family partition protein [Planctomycetota bacterium]